MPRLDSGQRRIVRRIKQIGREVGASPKEIKAALETGRVESGFRNLSGGDADSAGWRQERASLYPNPTDLDASIRRFYAEAKALRGKYGRAGDLAAAVQRPAAQYRGRYQAASGLAQALLEGGGGAGGASGSSSAAPPGSAPTRPSTPGVDNSALRGQAIAQFLGRRNQDPLDFALNIRSLQDVASSGQGSTRALTGRPASSPSPAPGGNGALQPGGGYAGSQGLATSLAGIGRELGLKVMSTKRNNTNPYSGSRSDHDNGNKDAYAYDISSGGSPNESMDRTAYRVMRQLGFKDYQMGEPINTSRGVKTIKTAKGTFRVQVIYRGSGSAFGGNHLNHVHIGVKRVG